MRLDLNQTATAPEGSTLTPHCSAGADHPAGVANARLNLIGRVTVRVTANFFWPSVRLGALAFPGVDGVPLIRGGA
jgi:hypothetical protein